MFKVLFTCSPNFFESSIHFFDIFCFCSLTDLENTNTKLLYALKNSGAEKICDAYRWVQEHRGELNKEVFGPVLLEVNVSLFRLLCLILLVLLLFCLLCECELRLRFQISVMLSSWKVTLLATFGRYALMFLFFLIFSLLHIFYI